MTLLALTGLVCIIGTLMDYDASLALIFNTWWFLSLLAFTSLSILCATWRTLTITIPNDRKPIFITKPQDIALLPAHLETDKPICQEELAIYLRRRKYKVFTQENALCAMAGNAQRYGAVITHCGLLILFLGAAIQITCGFSGHLTLREGESSDSFIPAGTDTPAPLGFTVHLVDFEMKCHPNSNIPSQFTSTVEVIDGAKVLTAAVEVNRSFIHNGMVFHQNSYNLLPNISRYILDIRTPSSSAKPLFFEANLGERTRIPQTDYNALISYKNDGVYCAIFSPKSDMQLDEDIIAAFPDYSLELIDFMPDFQLDENMRPYSASSELHNPAIQVLLREGGDEIAASWLFLRPELRAFSHKAFPLKLVISAISSQKAKMPVAVPQLEDVMVTVQVLNPATEKPFTTLTLMQGIPVAVFQKEQHISGDDTATSNTAVPTGKWVKKAEKIGAYSSTIGISHSPGIPYIYLGCALLTLGPIFSFSISRRKIWAICESNRTCIGGRARVSIEALIKEISEFYIKSKEMDAL